MCVERLETRLKKELIKTQIGESKQEIRETKTRVRAEREK